MQVALTKTLYLIIPSSSKTPNLFNLRTEGQLDNVRQQ
jgi:hypothetical protein